MASNNRLIWPIAESYDRSLPLVGEAGSFKENRGNGNIHRGVDIYAPYGSKVIAPEPLEIVKVGFWTTSEGKPYWNDTVYALAHTKSGEILNFAELDDTLDEGARIDAGTLIGRIGQVLNPEKVDQSSPSYIRKLIESGNLSMIHLENYVTKFLESSEYKAGLMGTSVHLDYFKDPAEFLTRCD